MSIIVRFFTAVLFVLTLSVCRADNFVFTYYYPPGGGTDIWSAPLIASLQDKGHVVKQEFYKSCYEAIAKASAYPNAFVVIQPMDISQSAGRCPSLKDYPTFKSVANLSAASYYLCTSPHKTHLALVDLTGRETLKVAMSSASVSTVSFANIVNNSSPKLNLRAIPYEANQSARAAVIAGTDVDLIYVANGVESIVSAGSKCLASSTRKNYYNLPFLGQSAMDKVQDFYVTIDLWAFGTPSKEHQNLINEALQSKTFKDFLAARPTSINLGMDK